MFDVSYVWTAEKTPALFVMRMVHSSQFPCLQRLSHCVGFLDGKNLRDAQSREAIKWPPQGAVIRLQTAKDKDRHDGQHQPGNSRKSTPEITNVGLHTWIPARAIQIRVPKLLQRLALQVRRQGRAEVGGGHEKDQRREHHPPNPHGIHQRDKGEADGDFGQCGAYHVKWLAEGVELNRLRRGVGSAFHHAEDGPYKCHNL